MLLYSQKVSTEPRVCCLSRCSPDNWAAVSPSKFDASASFMTQERQPSEHPFSIVRLLSSNMCTKSKAVRQQRKAALLLPLFLPSVKLSCQLMPLPTAASFSPDSFHLRTILSSLPQRCQQVWANQEESELWSHRVPHSQHHPHPAFLSY